jgi:hypothetical protein
VGDALGYVDEEGTQWSVTEHDMREVAGARGLRCLVFASRYAFRRVWHFPARWRDLPPAELAELSWAH